MSNAEQLSVESMRDLVLSGEARPLFVEFDIGPTSYAGQWWHVPAGADGGEYVHVDAEYAERLDQMRTRLAGIDAFLESA